MLNLNLLLFNLYYFKNYFMWGVPNFRLENLSRVMWSALTHWSHYSILETLSDNFLQPYINYLNSMTYEIKPVLSNLNFRKLMKTCLWECIPILVRLFWTLIYFEVMNPTWIWSFAPKRVCLWVVLDLSAILRNLHRNLALFQEWSVLNLNQICLLAGKSSK